MIKGKKTTQATRKKRCVGSEPVELEPTHGVYYDLRILGACLGMDYVRTLASFKKFIRSVGFEKACGGALEATSLDQIKVEKIIVFAYLGWKAKHGQTPCAKAILNKEVRFKG